MRPPTPSRDPSADPARPPLEVQAASPPPRAPKRVARPTLNDLIAGLSVAMIAVPQALAYAVLAGMPPHVGLYALATSAVAAAPFASSPYLQTGPTAITSILVLSVLSPLETPGSGEYLLLAGLLALLVGIMRVLVGVLRLGAVAYLLSQPLLLGFTSAAALLIAFSQLPAALGVQGAPGSVLQAALYALARPGVWYPSALALAAGSVFIILLGRRLSPRFPGVLVVVVLGLLLALAGRYAGPVVGYVAAGLPSLTFGYPWGAIPSLLLGALVIAFIGFAEAASIARTYATRRRENWSANREFVAQGVANLAAGAFGGFPVGGSFGRSSLNIAAGARTRWSGLFTGLAVLAFLPFTSLVALLPMSVLAGVVIVSVLPLVRLRALLAVWRFSKPQALLSWLTFGLTLSLAPRLDYAVLIGISAAIVIHLWREQNIVVETWAEEGTAHVRPMGVLWFGSAYQLDETLDRIMSDYPDAEALWLHLDGLGRIDLSGAYALRRMMDDASEAGLAVMVLDVPPGARKWVRTLLSSEEADRA